jgi:hypothetical protein
MTNQPQDKIIGVLTSGDPNGYFSNGLHQNALFLYKCLKKVPMVKPVLVFYPLSSKKEWPDEVEIFGETAYNLELFYDKYHLDALLLVSVALNNSVANKLKKNRVKLVAVVYGNRYVMDQETMCFGDLLPSAEGKRNFANRSLMREDVKIDAVWMSPHFAWQKDYIKHRYDAPTAHVCPYIWGPDLLLQQYKQDKHYDEFGPLFRPGNPKNKNLFATEPNINVLKTSLFPFQAANLVVERENPNFGEILLFGSRHHRLHNKPIQEYFQSMKLLKDKKVFFEDRWKFSTITKHAQVMFHHHFENGLNYTMLEAATLRLPVVHNSEFMPELGYYYKRANLTDAATQIEAALVHEHRDDLDEYNKLCEGVVKKFHYGSYDNVRGHQTLIANLFSPDIEPELPQYIVDLEYKLDHGDGYISPIG